MTMTANRVNSTSPCVKVTTTYGPVTASVEEDYRHLRSFHTQLGKILDDMEAENDRQKL
jgi:hypothetical protein